ncbi:hypothetical protein BCV72DRAFT_209085, partial [Rhizopus microsporus var. microsporus]
LPPNFSWQDLKDLFRKAGRVLHTDVFNDPETRRPNGTGVVIFDNLSDTRHAISTLNGYNLHGNRIEVMQEKLKDVQADINQVTTPPRTAFTAGVVTPASATAVINAHTTNIPPPPPPMSSLPFSTTWQDLIDLFRHVGPVMRAEILVINGYPKGAGYVRFEDAETCQRAIDRFNGYIYGGRALDIKMDKYSTTL